MRIKLKQISLLELKSTSLLAHSTYGQPSAKKDVFGAKTAAPSLHSL
jgi:hypothetical protein